MDNININGSVESDTVQKWSPVLEGIENDYTRRVTAQLLENQAKAIISEKVRMDEDVAQGIGGTTTTTRLGAFQKFAFPLVRRVYPELIANNIVGVQPMQGPVSQIFYLGNSRRDGLEGTEQSIYSKYNLTYRGKVASQIMGGANFQTDGNAAADGFDVSQLINNSSGAPSTTVGGQIADFPMANRMRGLATGPASLLGFNVSAGERLEGSGIPEMMFNIEQQPVAARTRKMRALWTLEASQDLKAYHNLDLEQELTDLLGKELRLEIDREIIEDLRFLAYGFNKANTLGPDTWTNGHGVGHAINNEMWSARSLDQSYDGNTGTNFNWSPDFTDASTMDYDFAGRYTQSDTNSTYDNVYLLDFSDNSLSFAPQHVGHVYANLMALCHRAATDIYKTTLRGPGNFIVTSPTVAAMLHAAAKMEGGVERTDGPTNMNGAKVEYRGKLGGQFDLYVDPMYPEDEIMIGYKGANAMDSGYVYAPYIPLQQTPTITDPETFQPRKGIITRYGKATVAPPSRFYRIIRLIGPTANYLFTPYVAVKSNAFA